MFSRVASHWTLKHLLQSVGLLCLCVPVELTAADSLPPLLKQTKVLACAQTAGEAQVALSGLWEIEDTEKEFPDENMRSSIETTLHAATLDIVLKSIVNTSERFPSLRNQVERTLLKWNYCDVFQDGVFYDLNKRSTGMIRTKAATNSPEDWQGFKALGFLGENENRFIPNILALDQQSLRSDYEWLFHRIFREQCFPHPDTSELFDSTEYRLKERIAVTTDTAAIKYPYQWDPECVYPRQAPILATRVSIEMLPFAVPKLNSQLQLLPVPQLVPGLLTQVKLADQKITVPTLQSSVIIHEVPLLVPGLDTQVVMNRLALKVPTLSTRLLLDPKAYAVPKLSTRVRLQPVGLSVPGLSTRVQINKPKIVAKKPKAKNKIPAKYVANRGQNNGYPRGNYNNDNYNRSNIRIVEKPQALTKPNLVLDKNSSLLERILGGLSGGGNVLIVDKIQLTVNEYNGTVETAISSSDIGSTLTTAETNPAFVHELLRSLPATQKSSVASAGNTVKKETHNKPVSVPPPYVAVPELQSILLVSQVPTISSHKPIKIRDKKQRVTKRKPKIRVAGKPKKSPKRNKKDKTSSSLFIYDPYPKDKPAEKSIEQLLLEYQEYEERRKLGKQRPKKKQLGSNPAILTDVPPLSTRVLHVPIIQRKVGVPSLSPKLWIEKVEVKSVKVPALKTTIRIYSKHKPTLVSVPSLNSKVRIYRKYQIGLIKVPSLDTMVLQQLVTTTRHAKKTKLLDKISEKTLVREKVSGETFMFSKDRLPDKVFEDTLVSPRTASTVTTPTFLSNDAPLPYVIEERSSREGTKQNKLKKRSIGLAGNIYLKHSLKNSVEAVGGSINRKLIKDSYWFARVGWNYTLEESDDPFSYSWGIGYSDWHPGTFSAQLNNWGPIKPDEGLALEKAVANFGYSVKSELLKKYRLSLSGSVNIPVEGNSSIVGNLRWSPKENWFVNASVSQPLEGDGTPKWTYGFGYSDWRPNKINLQYSNYGPNEIPYHNYETNGTWSLSYNWKF